MLLKIQRLGEGKDFLSFGTGDDHDAVIVGANNVARLNLYAVTYQGNIRAAEAVVVHRSRWHYAERKNRQADLAELAQIAHATGDNRAGISAGLHCRSQSAAHPGHMHY